MVTDSPAHRHAEFIAALTAARDALDALEARATEYRHAYANPNPAMKGHQRDAYERGLTDLMNAALHEATDAVGSITDAVAAWWPTLGRTSWHR